MFSESVIEKAWKRAGGKCERCGKQLVFKNRGRNSGRGEWEPHHKSSAGGDVLSNCEILCVECHKNTRNFGKPH